MLLTILIPCLNEAHTITRAIKQAQTALRQNHLSKKEAEIVVADNGSTDGSQLKITKQKIARLIQVSIKGYGAALHYGILSAKGRYVFFADADLSYSFKELKNFLAVIRLRQTDLVLGSRLQGRIAVNAMPFLHRYFGTPLLTFLIRVMYHLPTTDCNSGMRLVRKAFYRHLQMRNSGMEWASELLIRTAIYKGKYTEVKIKFFPDQRLTRPHLLPWMDGWRHLKAIILLQPNSLWLGVVLFSGIAIGSLNFSTSMAAFWTLAAFGLFLSLVAAHLIHFSSIVQQKNLTSEILLQLPLITICAVASLAVILYISFLSLTNHQATPLALFLASVVIILDVWLFFIETIKTHFLHRLPERVK